MRRRLVVFVSGWIFGIALASKVSVDWRLWAGVSVLLAAAGWMEHRYFRRLLPLTLFFVGLFAGGAHLGWTEEGNRSAIAEAVPQDAGEVRAFVAGRIASVPEMDGDRLRFTLEVRSFAVEGARPRSIPGERVATRVMLRSAREQDFVRGWKRGTKIVAPVILERPSPARNPGGFDYRRHLYRQGIHWTARIDGLTRVTAAPDPSPGFRGAIDDLRRWLGERVEALYPEETAGLVRAMILGEREAVPPDAEEDFALLGLAHLLAISGLHVGVFVGSIYEMLKAIGLTREKAAGAVLLLLPPMALLTGAGAPVVRASIMAGFALLAVILRRWRDGLTFLAVAAWVLLLWNPYQLFQPGFQLSFAVTLALLVGAGPVAGIMPFPWTWLNRIAAVTLVAQLASFPLIIFHFYEFSFLSWGINLAAVPVVSLLVIPLAMLALALGSVHEGLAFFPALLSSSALSALLKGTDFLARWSWAHPSWSPPPVWWLAAYAVVCFQGLVAWTGDVRRKALHRTAFLLMMFGLVAYAWAPEVFVREREVRIAFLDVGQGDCAVIETPGGQVILVDGGGRLPLPRQDWQRRRKEHDVGRDVVVPYLKYRGIREIDYLVITHGDADHVGGLGAVAERFPVRRVIRNPHAPGSEVERRLMRLLEERGAAVYTAPRGSGWSLEPGVAWQFLHPEREVSPGEKTNDDSVVFLLYAYGRTVLMTGDIEKGAEREIAAAWNLPPVDWLKVAHHGSRTSTHSAWLKEVHPAQAVISVGEHNRFGHPAPEVLRRLEERGVRIWRTDRHGAVTVRISPSGRMRVETMLATD
ncbi:DNA internalization-related competence protein ComEC/Rec2 [Planifilum fimeticola]